MIKEAARLLDLALFGELALVIFVVVFVGWSLWALLQSRQTVRRWAELALHDDHAAAPVHTPSTTGGTSR